MHAYTINVKSNPLMRQSRVDSDIALGLTLGGVGFWQEFAPQRYKASLARQAHQAGCSVYGLEVEVPITLRDDFWTVEDHGVIEHKMHGGLAHVTPTRYTTVVKARPGPLGRGHRKTAFVNKHPVAGGWSSKSHFLPTRKQRQQFWAVDYAKTVEIVAGVHDEGYDIVLGADFNHPVSSMPKFHPNQFVGASHGIDGIIAIPAKGHTVSFGTPRVIGVGHFTDHDPVAVDLGFHTP